MKALLNTRNLFFLALFGIGACTLVESPQGPMVATPAATEEVAEVRLTGCSGAPDRLMNGLRDRISGKTPGTAAEHVAAIDAALRGRGTSATAEAAKLIITEGSAAARKVYTEDCVSSLT
jgi:hypothetical protein